MANLSVFQMAAKARAHIVAKFGENTVQSPKLFVAVCSQSGECLEVGHPMQTEETTFETQIRNSEPLTKLCSK